MTTNTQNVKNILKDKDEDLEISTDRNDLDSQGGDTKGESQGHVSPKHPDSCFEIMKSKRMYKCPYEDCKRLFKEKGNLRTHIRVHVSAFKFIFRLERDHSFVIMKAVVKHLLLWGI
jgi:hypothetical protein